MPKPNSVQLLNPVLLLKEKHITATEVCNMTMELTDSKQIRRYNTWMSFPRESSLNRCSGWTKQSRDGFREQPSGERNVHKPHFRTNSSNQIAVIAFYPNRLTVDKIFGSRYEVVKRSFVFRIFWIVIFIIRNNGNNWELRIKFSLNSYSLLLTWFNI
jgi:hypothetical protein